MTIATLPAFDRSHAWTSLGRHFSRRPAGIAAPALRAVEPVISLARHHSRTVTAFLGGQVACVNGCVWLTHDGDCRDIVLEAGQTHAVDRDSRLVIHALNASEVRLTPPVGLCR